MGQAIRWECRSVILAICLLLPASLAAASGEDAGATGAGSTHSEQPASPAAANQNEIAELKRQLAEQQRQIEELRLMLYAKAKRIDDNSGRVSAPAQPPASGASRLVGETASLAPVIPSAP